MPSYSVTIYFEPDPANDAEASFEMNVDADSEVEAIEKAEAMNVLGYSAELNESDDPAER